MEGNVLSKSAFSNRPRRYRDTQRPIPYLPRQTLHNRRRKQRSDPHRISPDSMEAHALTPTHPVAATKTPELQSLSHQTIQLANLTDIKRSDTVPTEQSALEKDCCENDSEAVFHDSVTPQASPSHFEISPVATPSFSLSPQSCPSPQINSQSPSECNNDSEKQVGCADADTEASNHHSYDGSSTQSDQGASNHHSTDISAITSDAFIYSGAPITANASQLLVTAYVSRHQLSKSATDDLLKLISLHCPAPNRCFTSVHSLQAHKPSHAEVDIPMVKHFFCPECYVPLPTMNNVSFCPNSACHTTLDQASVSFFIELPILDQLQQMFASTYIPPQSHAYFFV